MRLGSGGVPARQRGAPKRPAVLGRVAAAHSDFLRFAVEPETEEMRERQSCFEIAHAVVPCVTAERSETAECREDADGTVGVRVSRS